MLKEPTEEPKAICPTATILAVLGSIFGLEIALFLLLFGSLAPVFGAAEISPTLALGRTTIYLVVIGIIGAVIVNQKPRIAGILMLLSGIGGFMAVSLAYVIAGPLLIVAGILALLKK